MSRCRRAACLKMLKLWQQKKKFIHTTTMLLHLSCSVIPLSSCVLHRSEDHAMILSMHTNAYRQWWLKVHSACFFPPHESVCLGVCQHRGRCRFRSKSPRQSLRWVGGLGLFAIDTPIDGLSWECTFPTNWYNSFDVQRSPVNTAKQAFVCCLVGVCELQINCLVNSEFMSSATDSPLRSSHAKMHICCVLSNFSAANVRPAQTKYGVSGWYTEHWCIYQRNATNVALLWLDVRNTIDWNIKGYFLQKFWPIANLLASQS